MVTYVLQRAGTRERVSARARYVFYSCLLPCAPSMVRTGASERRRARVFRLRLGRGGAQTPSGIFFTPSESVSSALSETSASSSSSSMSSVDLWDLNSPA